jgi:predicted lysophospholipase L1 biosynthesis ABC-type transport system permease subunit
MFIGDVYIYMMVPLAVLGIVSGVFYGAFMEVGSTKNRLGFIVECVLSNVMSAVLWPITWTLPAVRMPYTC